MLCCCIGSLNAQEVPPEKQGNLEFGLGFNIFGPAQQMAKLMVEHNFDMPFENWFGGAPFENPSYDRVGLSFHISYSRYLSLKSQFGIQVHYSSFGQIRGYSTIAWHLSIRFSSIYVNPIYKYDLGDYWELQIGPAIMINRGREVNPYDKQSQIYSKPSLGMLTGLNLKMWGGPRSNGKISAHYLVTIRNNMGPYVSEGWPGNISTIPESKIGFGHLNIVFALGFHL